MYYAHFGLSQAPFKITPNTEFFYGGGNRGPILEALIYAVTHGEGIVKVTGEVGSGKTMLCSMLQTRLPASVEIVYLANPSVSPEEILHAIAFELQIDVPRDASRLVVMHALQAYLLKRHAEHRRVVVFVEESQSMSLATLEEIRLLSNLETKNDKLMQIVLFGQPELDENLRESRIRQLRERITHSFRLEPLDVNEVREYLMFRMRAAGYRGPDLFPNAIVKTIADASNGLTRRVNLVADKALLAAFSENTHTIKMKHVEAAVRDSEFSRTEPEQSRSRYAVALTLLAAGILIGAGSYALLQSGDTRPPAPEATAPPTPPAAATPPAVTPSAPVPVAAPVSAPTTPAITEPATAAPAQSAEISKTPIETTAKSDTAQVAAPPPAAPAATTAPPAAEPAGPKEQALTATSDVVSARLAATREWLAQAPETTYAIQLLGADNEDQLKHHLNVLVKSIEINKLFVYRTLAKDRPSLTLVYGGFGDRQSAREALAKLPTSLKIYRPILRTVNGIRAEIRQNQTS